MYVVRGEYGDVLRRLFVPIEGGRLSFGWATSEGPVADATSLCEWTVFRDYIMEGFVLYSVRARAMPSGMAIEVRLTGTNRDQYVGSAIRQYIKWAGLDEVPLETSAEA